MPQAVRRRERIIIDYYNLIIYKQRRMHAYRQKKGFVWQKKQQAKSQNINQTFQTDIDDFGTLKKEVKRIQIMTRMEKRAKTCMTKKSVQRPTTTSNPRNSYSRPSDFKKVEQLYLRQKSLMRSALEENKEQKQHEHGLLGEWKRYEQFTKQELIEKLISLEYLANTIFKKNKHLEQELKKIQSTQKIEQFIFNY